MNRLAPLVVTGIAALAALALTGVARRHAIARALLDVPNARSSHRVPTPTGGGLAIVGVVLVGALVLGAVGLTPWRVVVALTGGGAQVAWIGWRDDRQHVPAGVRAAVHAGAAAWAVAWLGGLTSFALGTVRVPLGIAGAALAVVAIVWCVNLYNFMDGIDGLAGVEAVTVAGTLGAILCAAGHAGLGLAALLVAGAAAGFLYWNRPPARIFMGDVGSGFLGYVLAVLGTAAERTATAAGTALLTLLLAAFVVDATATLLRRVAHGERWAEAHRKHAYQRAVQSGLTHGQVTAGVLGLDLALAALAWATAFGGLTFPAALACGLTLVLLAYAVVERRRPMYPAPETVRANGRGENGRRAKAPKA